MISIQDSNYKSFVDIHSNSIIEYCNITSKKYKLSQINNLIASHFNNIVTSFEDLLTADPDELKNLKIYFDNLSNSQQDIIKIDLDFRTIYGYFAKNVKYFPFVENGTKVYYSSNFLANKIDVFTCPYCNENYTYCFDYNINKRNTLRRTFDWDHIYSQDQYPFFAISYFNLTPACKPCNQIKLDQNKQYFNPHSKVNINDLYSYVIAPIDAGFISDKNKIKLEIIINKKNKFKNEAKDTIETLGVLTRYRCHKEIIKNIINKKRIYPTSYRNSLNNQILSLNGLSQINLKTTLWGTYFDEKDYYKQPFSKLTNDILDSPNSD